MFKVGDKIKNNATGTIFTVTGFDTLNDIILLVTEFGHKAQWGRDISTTHFTKVDSDADSSGLYGVDSSESLPNTFVSPIPWNMPLDKDSHTPYKTNQIYTIPTSRNWKITCDDAAAAPKTKSQCECGALKTYGKSCNPEFHQSYCEMSKK